MEEVAEGEHSGPRAWAERSGFSDTMPGADRPVSIHRGHRHGRTDRVQALPSNLDGHPDVARCLIERIPMSGLSRRPHREVERCHPHQMTRQIGLHGIRIQVAFADGQLAAGDPRGGTPRPIMGDGA